VTTRSTSATERVKARAEALVARAAAIRLPDLFTQSRAGAVYRVSDRNGVSSVVLGTDALSKEELMAILQFRFAQYLACGFADPAVSCERRIEHESLSSTSSSDHHVIVGNAHTGEILCYLAVRRVQPAWPRQRMRSHQRQPFPVEEMHGMGIFDRLNALPDMQVARVCEVGRFVKNQRLHVFDELGTRAPIEALVALIRTMTGPLRSQVDACVGELEEDVVKRNLDFFNVPTLLVRGTVSYEAPSVLLGHTGRVFYPFAFSVADFAAKALDRTAAIERALALPGKAGIREIFALKRNSAPRSSCFEPPEGLPPLAAVDVPHADIPMPRRLEMRRAGERLRSLPRFEQLTVPEATVLRTFMHECRAAPGELLAQEGEAPDALLVIEAGEAEVLPSSGNKVAVRRIILGPGGLIGDAALAFESRMPATVVARTDMSLLRLPADLYQRFLATIPGDSAFRRLDVRRIAA
jgi:hypothetical protein